MPPKRKTGGGGGRGKRPRQSSPDVESSEGRILTGQQTEDTDAPEAPRITEEGSSKLLDTTLLMDGDADADADGEADDDKMDATHDEDAEGEREETGDPQEGEQQQHDTRHEPVNEGSEDHRIAEAMPSTRGRGRGRGRRARGTSLGSTRSSPRKAHQQTQAQHTSKPPNPRGRKAARGREKGAFTSNHLPAGPPTNEKANTGNGEEDGAEIERKKGNNGNKDERGQDETKAEVINHQLLPRLPSQQQPHQAQQADLSQSQPSHQIHSAAQSLHTQAGSFPQHAPAFYPNYPPQATHFQYAYGGPPPAAPNAPDGRPYLALRPDQAQPVYTTSFATTVGTGNEPDSTSSSFNAPYPSAAVSAHPLDANAPQGNPFPPTAPMPVPAYGTNVYRVNMSEEEDDDDQGQEQNVGTGVHAPPQKKKTQSASKGGGRTGRGDHVACHFCRGRKLKCDGRRPTCGHCALRNQACAYDASVRRRGPGRKEKNNRRDRNGTNSKRTGSVVVSDLSVDPQPSTQSHSQVTTPSTEGVKRKRRHAVHAPHAVSQSQAGMLRFEDGEGTGVPVPAMKPATAAYGVENNERLGFYYVGGGPGQFGPPYPPYGGYDQAPSTHPPPQQTSYGYAQEGGETDADGNGDMDAEGDGDGEHEVYGSRPEQGGSYGQPPNGNYSHAWPAEPPGGVPVSHPQHM